MKEETKTKILRLTADATDLLLEPDILKDDGAEHCLYSVVRTLNKLINELNSR